MTDQRKTAIVTGAGTGIGLAISKNLIEIGYSVYGLGRRMDVLDKAQTQLGEAFKPVSLDISDSKSVQDWFSKIDEPIHILVNNAGIAHFNSVDKQTIKEWDTMIGVNLSGVFYITHLVAAQMKEKQTLGYIINIASVAALIGNPNLSGYNATKFGLKGFSEAIMKELRPFGIRVSCIFPGSVATPFFDDKGVKIHDDMLQGEDIASCVTFLLDMPQRALVDEIVIRPTYPK
jgi:NADP-dependent 3-hydroxy acid dehydrogenase YdfG